VRPPERELLSPDELVRLAEAVPDRYRALVLVGGVLGLRWGEAVGLRACDVDFMRRTVTVAQVVEEIAGHLRVVPGEAKTTGSLRTLAAPPFLIDELARHLHEHRPEAVGDRLALVFVGPRGGILRRRFADRTFRPAVERAGLDQSLTFHGLRHVAMSTLVDENVHPRVMQGRAVHASSKLTMELYAHVTDEADREAAKGKQKGRTLEIQRLIGRALRAVTDASAMGEVEITLDCDVLQADGGTRTASICGAYVALHDACTRLVGSGIMAKHPLTEACAAVSVGLSDGHAVLDLDYHEDHRAEVDMNVVMTASGRFVEVQGTAEGAAFSRGDLDALLGLAEHGIKELLAAQAAVLATPPAPRP